MSVVQQGEGFENMTFAYVIYRWHETKMQQNHPTPEIITSNMITQLINTVTSIHKQKIFKNFQTSVTTYCQSNLPNYLQNSLKTILKSNNIVIFTITAVMSHLTRSKWKKRIVILYNSNGMNGMCKSGFKQEVYI